MSVDYRIRNFLIAALLAAAAVALTIVYVSSAREEDKAAATSVKVYTAAKDFNAGASGASVAAALEEQTVTKDTLVKGAVTDPAQIEGLYLTQPVVAGEQLTVKRFALPSEQGVRARLLGKQRVVQVSGDANQVLKGTLVPGDRVDVVVNIQSQRGGLGDSKVVTALRDIRVLETSDAEDTEVENPTTNGLYAVLLGVTDKQAERLHYVTHNGEWSLVLRPVKKPKDSTTGVVTLSQVLSGGQ